MVTLATELFKTLLNNLEARRIAAGGELSQEEESEACAELDTLWWQMSDAEQAEVEAHCAKTPNAPTSLNLVDATVPLGSHSLPRKQA